MESTAQHPYMGRPINPNILNHMVRDWKAHIVEVFWSDGSSSYYLKFYKNERAKKASFRQFMTRPNAVGVELKTVLNVDDVAKWEDLLQ